MKPAFALAIALMLLTMGSVHAEPLPTVSGFWESDDDAGQPQAWFYFEEKEKGGPWVGHLVKGFKKPGDKFLENCAKCVGEQKNAKMSGLAIVNGMKRDGLSYKDGTILDPRDGSVYHAQMELSADGKELGVRGYVLMPMLGQTQTWKRLPDDAIPPADLAKMLGGSAPRQIAASPGPKKTPKPTSTPTVDPPAEQ